MELLKRLLLPVIMLLLGIGFWTSPTLQILAAGVALFLFGMMLLERGFQAFSGGILEQVLHRATQSTPRAMLFGAVATSVMQSSTLVSVLTISFLSAGMMKLGAGLGVIFGANLGTTTGAWLIAGFGLNISLSKLAMPLLIFGVLLQFQQTQGRTALGNILLGIGFLFLGIDYMKDGFGGMQDGLDLTTIAPGGIAGILLFTLFGILATVVLQSSHATLVLTLAALSVGQISYEAALALAIGANVGTAVTTAVFGSIGANSAGKRLAMGHLVFNLFTGVVALLMLPALLWIVEHLSHAMGIAADNHTMKLAVFHTLFNLLGIALMLPQLQRLQRFLERIIRTKEQEDSQPQYLNQAAMESPAAAVSVTRNESIRLYSLSTDLLIEGLGWHADEFNRGQPLPLLTDNSRSAAATNLQQRYEQQVKGIYSSIIGFISSAREKTSGTFDEQLRELRAADHHLIEAIKGVKHLQRNLLFYVHSENPEMAQAYQQLRLQIGDVLRTINDVRHMEEPTESRLALDHQLLLTERERELSDTLIEGLIRGRKITTGMATSLLTDKGYVYDICNSLLSAARYLFIDADRPQSEEPDNLNLEAAELSAINRQLDEQRSDNTAGDQP